MASFNRLSAKTTLRMANIKNRFVKGPTPTVSKTNIYAGTYGMGMFASMGAWFQVTKDNQEKEQIIEPKKIDSDTLVIPIVTIARENQYKSQWDDAREKHYGELTAKPWHEVSKKYIALLTQRENALEAELFNRFALTDQSWQQFKKDHYKEFVTSAHKEVKRFDTKQELDDRIISAFKSACQRSNVDCHKINLINAPADTQSTMFVNQHHLIVNQTLCLMPYFSDDQKREMSIAREIQHLLHDDTYDKYCIEKIFKLNHNKVDQKAYEAFARKVSHFKEERADILVALIHPQYGQTSKETFKSLSNPSWMLEKIAQSLGKDLKDPSPMTHPASLYRYNCVSQVHQEIVAEINKGKYGTLKSITV